MIEMRGIKKSFGNLKVLEDINLSVSEGEIYGLVGRSGAGKSRKYRSVDALPEGATITFAMDGSNKDRAIRMMRDYGMVTLAEKPASGMYTVIDITSNPRKFKFMEMDLYQLPRTLEEVDASIFSACYLVAAGQDLSSAICFSKDDADFPCGIVIREENKDTQWAKDIMEAISSDRLRQVAIDVFKGAYEILF